MDSIIVLVIFEELILKTEHVLAAISELLFVDFMFIHNIILMWHLNVGKVVNCAIEFHTKLTLGRVKSFEQLICQIKVEIVIHNCDVLFLES